ncbi:MAG: XRE family transcriptional regulator [Gemmatimonadetes bacterium]|nr:XRE family transcriptional regulator [Gemmatimonadota bacterium]
MAAGADAVRMLESWTRDDAAMQALLAEERSKAAVGRQIYELRTARGLTQKQLAELIGTKQPVIARLEDADYQGHSLAMLYRIAAALGCSLSVGFIARPRAARRKAHQAPPRLPARRPQVKTR